MMMVLNNDCISCLCLLSYKQVLRYKNAIGVPLEDVVEEEQQVEDEEDRDIGEDDDEMADFIVDEEVDETGAGLRYLFLTHSVLFLC